MSSYKDEIQEKTESNYQRIIKELPNFVDEYFSALKSKKQPRTILQYAYDIRLFFNWIYELPLFAGFNFECANASDVLDKLTIKDINKYLELYLSETYINNKGKEITRHFSDGFRARKASSLKSFYRYYYKVGLIKNDISSLIEVPIIHKQDRVVLAKDDVSKLLEAAADIANNVDDIGLKMVAKRDLAILATLFGTGIRVSELVGINIDDVKFKYDNGVYGSIKVLRKRGNNDTVYFGETVKTAIEDYIKNYRVEFFKNTKDHKQFMADPKSLSALFVSYGQRKRMSVRSVETLIKQYKLKAGYSEDYKITPHTCRRAYATALLSETNDIYLTSNALGHSSVETTKLYASLSEERKKDAGIKSEEIFKI